MKIFHICINTWYINASQRHFSNNILDMHQMIYSWFYSYPNELIHQHKHIISDFFINKNTMYVIPKSNEG